MVPPNNCCKFVHAHALTFRAGLLDVACPGFLRKPRQKSGEFDFKNMEPA